MEIFGGLPLDNDSDGGHGVGNLGLNNLINPFAFDGDDVADYVR